MDLVQWNIVEQEMEEKTWTKRAMGTINRMVFGHREDARKVRG